MLADFEMIVIFHTIERIVWRHDEIHVLKK
jgi:hypothetical protein